MWGYDHGGGLMGIGMILLWLIPIALLVWLFAKAASGRSGKDATQQSPREILDARYARGEIGRDEYQERRADLEGHNKE
jgi:putative membrane protein